MRAALRAVGDTDRNCLRPGSPGGGRTSTRPRHRHEDGSFEFRDSYVTHLWAAGIDDADLAAVAEHTVETMISVYTHALERSHDKVRAVIGRPSLLRFGISRIA